jgi:hypothetical protein
MPRSRVLSPGLTRRAAPWLLSLVASCSFQPSGGGGGDGGGSVADGSLPDPAIDGAPGIIDAGGGIVIDAAIGDPCVASLCPGECDHGTCVVVCQESGSDSDGEDDGAGGGACPEVVLCPAGVPCRVECNDADSCGGGVDCRAASSCEILCQGERSCGGPLECGAGRCTIECRENESCRGGMDCSDSCFCDIDCFGALSCFPETICPLGCDQIGDCRTTGPCNSEC